LISALPAAFMLAMTTWSLMLTVWPWASALIAGSPSLNWSAAIALVLLGLALLVLFEGLKAFANDGALGLKEPAA
jgi:hypothetical protein